LTDGQMGYGFQDLDRQTNWINENSKKIARYFIGLSFPPPPKTSVTDIETYWINIYDVVIHLHISFLLLMLRFFCSFYFCDCFCCAQECHFFYKLDRPSITNKNIKFLLWNSYAYEFDVLLSDCHLCLVYVKRCEKLLLL
jgi:hypothetical protein